MVHFVGGWDMAKERTHLILEQVWKDERIQDNTFVFDILNPSAGHLVSELYLYL